MRIARVSVPQGVTTVRVDDDGRFIPISDPYAALAVGEEPRDAADPVDGELVAPCTPTVLVGIAQNGPGHASPVQAWLKSPRTVTGPGVCVRLRRDAGRTVAEAEVAVVIGRDTTGLTAENAHEYVLGVTAVNDLSSPDRAAVDPRNFESKSGAGYTPLGPWIDTALSLDADLSMALLADGVARAETSAGRLPMTPRECLAYVAGWTTLGPGDVVMMGAPHSQSPIRAGERVEVVIGDLRLSTPTS
ncbi:2-keto-4-pentenoate hydratase/2-oxohepta-3-ene-1,7-dioic acid hydratase in catechol pathway [Microbacterium proteolyticum]|uniref:2-keto-4-pentenoate hydratase/2-oxohepta-3-ene-1,7-dioic acid hydratase in catechol pathway n=1 Tax=Microbacterium proteolyticum TaxID=1572644 RepID=A0A7W5CK96_9MICO|nr:fumarylacetoacetate hydrolase family protein [Microbacterium proteolyticum]MBB3158760.1 2-keto-4-pentenoate hydratase/2-oxohepta-3-ene-1,7-dioic acid hydratase in catechol pathway [Microbacterium proteolyticum]